MSAIVIGLGLVAAALALSETPRTSIGAAKPSKKALLARMEKLGAESDRLREKLRDLIWAEPPEGFFDLTEAQQLAFEAKQDKRMDTIKARREKIEDEMIEIDHLLRKR